MHVNYYRISEAPTLESCNFMTRTTFDINLDILNNFGPSAIDCATFYGRRIVSRKHDCSFPQYRYMYMYMYPLSSLFRGTAS